MSQDCLVDIIITMNKNCKGGTDMAQQKEGDSMGLFKKKNVKKSGRNHADQVSQGFR